MLFMLRKYYPYKDKTYYPDSTEECYELEAKDISWELAQRWKRELTEKRGWGHDYIYVVDPMESGARSRKGRATQ